MKAHINERGLMWLTIAAGLMTFGSFFTKGLAAAALLGAVAVIGILVIADKPKGN